MATIKLKGNEIHTIGNLPSIGSKTPNFTLIKTNLESISLKDINEKNIILNIFPSIDTGTCAASVKKFNSIIKDYSDVIILCISKDLPFAHGRFCGAEGIKNVQTLSDFQSNQFGKDYQTLIIDGPLRGLHSRALIVINQERVIVHTEQVLEIVDEPNYNKALSFI